MQMVFFSHILKWGCLHMYRIPNVSMGYGLFSAKQLLLLHNYFTYSIRFFFSDKVKTRTEFFIYTLACISYQVCIYYLACNIH